MFSIEITQVTREQVKKREYKEVGKKDDGEPEYDYVNNETTEDVTRVIYTQRVDALDLKKVIDAVNAPSQEED